MICWRISNYADFSGIGGLGTGGPLHRGRCHNRGRPIVYLAQSAASALLEAPAHTEASHPRELPRQYQLLEVDVPDVAPLINARYPFDDRLLGGKAGSAP